MRIESNTQHSSAIACGGCYHCDISAVVVLAVDTAIACDISGIGMDAAREFRAVNGTLAGGIRAYRIVSRAFRAAEVDSRRLIREVVEVRLPGESR